jgi:spermidine/putrescine transport system substrate-binding protein
MKKDINSLSPEARAIIRAQVSRRSVLAGVGAVSAAGLLAACGTGSSTGAKVAVDVSDTEKIVRWANWTYYLDFDEASSTNPSLLQFEKESGIDATYDEAIDDNNTFYGKVQGQLSIGTDIGYDIVTPTDWMVGRWIDQGYAQKLDPANVPNKSNIRESLSNVYYDQGRQYSLTWQSGFAGFGWNTQKLPKGVRTMDDLFSPANKGKVLVLSELRDTIGLILLSQGVDPASNFTEDQYMNAIDFLKGKIQDGFIRQVKGNSYTEDLQRGDANAVIGWSGDLFGLRQDTDGKFDFAIPESGGILWSDNVLIPSTSTHKKNAEKLINYYYDPVNAAKVAAAVVWVCPVEGTQQELAKIDPKRAESTFIFPDAATLAKVKVFRSLSADESTKFQTAFDEAIGN